MLNERENISINEFIKGRADEKYLSNLLNQITEESQKINPGDVKNFGDFKMSLIRNTAPFVKDSYLESKKIFEEAEKSFSLMSKINQLYRVLNQ